MTGKQFKAIRKRLGLSAAELGAHLGYSRIHIHQLESGRREVGRVLELLMQAYRDHGISLNLDRAPQ